MTNVTNPPEERRKTPEQPQVKILDKALRVLMLFTHEHPEWGVTGIARHVDMSKSTVHRILRVLERHGFLMRDPDTRQFRLGLAGIELGWRAQEGLELRRIALPTMEQLSTQSGETVMLEVVSSEGDRIVCIERVQQKRRLRLMLDVGSTAPLHAGCSSKVLLAFMDNDAIEEVLRSELRPLTAHTMTDPTQIRAELAKIRRSGMATSFEETDEGVAGVSAPVRDARNRVVAGLTISGPIMRVNAATIDRYADMVRDGARHISAKLGHKGSPLPRSSGVAQRPAAHTL